MKNDRFLKIFTSNEPYLFNFVIFRNDFFWNCLLTHYFIFSTIKISCIRRFRKWKNMNTNSKYNIFWYKEGRFGEEKEIARPKTLNSNWISKSNTDRHSQEDQTQEELMMEIKLLLQELSITFPVDTEKFKDHTLKTDNKYIKLFLVSHANIKSYCSNSRSFHNWNCHSTNWTTIERWTRI